MKYYFSGNTILYVFHYWNYLTNVWRNNWRSIIDVVERLCYWHLYLEIPAFFVIKVIECFNQTLHLQDTTTLIWELRAYRLATRGTRKGGMERASWNLYEEWLFWTWGQCMWHRPEGAFFNYVDQILPIFLTSYLV